MELLSQTKNSLTGFRGSPYRNFLDLTAAGSQHGTFDPVTCRGDFRIKFKTVFSEIGAAQILLGDTITGAPNYVIFQTNALRANFAGAGMKTFGVPVQNKLSEVELVRTGMTVIATVNGAQSGTAYTCPGDVVLDRAFANSYGNYFDNVIADLEIIDLDQPLTRDVLTLESAGSMKGTIDAWAPSGDFEVEVEFTVTGDEIGWEPLVGSQAIGELGMGISGKQPRITEQSEVDGPLSGIDIELGVVNHVTYKFTVNGAVYDIEYIVNGVPSGVLASGVEQVDTNITDIGAFDTRFLNGSLLDVKLHDLTNPSNSRRYRFDTASATTVPNFYNPGTNDLTLNNITTAEWESMTRQTNGDLVGPVTTLQDPNYQPPADILWPIKSGKGYELNKRAAVGPELVVNGGFDVDTSGWTVSGAPTISAADGQATITRNFGAVVDFPRQLIVTTGKTYVVTLDVISAGSSVSAYVGGSELIFTSTGLNQSKTTTAGADGLGVRIGPTGGGSETPCVVDNISVREVQNPLTYVNIIESDFEKYRKKGRDWVNGYWPNLLKYSGDLTNAIWTKLALTFTPSQVMSNGVLGSSTTTTDDLALYAVYDQTNAVWIKDETAYAITDEATAYSHTFTVPAGCAALRVYALRRLGGAKYAYQVFSSTPGEILTFSWVAQKVGDTYTVAAQLNEGATALPYRKTEAITAKILEAP